MKYFVVWESAGCDGECGTVMVSISKIRNLPQLVIVMSHKIIVFLQCHSIHVTLASAFQHYPTFTSHCPALSCTPYHRPTLSHTSYHCPALSHAPITVPLCSMLTTTCPALCHTHYCCYNLKQLKSNCRQLCLQEIASSCRASKRTSLFRKQRLAKETTSLKVCLNKGIHGG